MKFTTLCIVIISFSLQQIVIFRSFWGINSIAIVHRIYTI